MNLITLVSLSVLAALASSQVALIRKYYDLNNTLPLFEEFVKRHKRVYKDDADREVHHQAFIKNLARINQYNKNSPSATFGINKFADYTDEEKHKMHGFQMPPPTTESSEDIW